MKRYITYFIYSVVILLGASACSKDESEPSAEERFLADLSGTWQVSDVTLDGVDVTEEFDGMAITFDENKTFSVANSVGNIWPSSGMFELQDASGDLFDLMRDDDVVVSVDQLTDASLVLSLQFDSAPGRQRGLAGSYEFTLTR